MAGLEGYTTSIKNPTPEFVIGAYHQLWRIEKSFRMSKHDLCGRAIYHHKRESIDAHLTIVFAALAITRLIENRTDWSIKSSSPPHAATAPFRSAPANNCSQPRTRCPPNLRDALAQIT